MRDWENQEVMLPILNRAKRNVTLHTSVDLCNVNIQRQWKKQQFKKKAPTKAVMRSLEPPKIDLADLDNSRAFSQLSLISDVSVEHPKKDLLMSKRMTAQPCVSPNKTTTFHNTMLRQATELGRYSIKKNN